MTSVAEGTARRVHEGDEVVVDEPQARESFREDSRLKIVKVVAEGLCGHVGAPIGSLRVWVAMMILGPVPRSASRRQREYSGAKERGAGPPRFNERLP